MSATPISSPDQSASLSKETVSVKPISPVVLLVSMTLFAALAIGVSLPIFPFYQPPAELMIPSPPDHIAVAREASLWNCRLANSQLLFTGVFAAGVGGLCAAAGAWKNKGKFNPPVAFLVGAIIASIGSALAIFLAHLINEMNLDPDYHIYRTMGVQVVLMSVFGAGLGMAIGTGCLGKGRLATYVVNGIGAGVVAAVLYMLVTSFALPESQTDYVVPGGVLNGSKDVALLCVWFGSMALAYSFIIPMHSKKSLA